MPTATAKLVKPGTDENLINLDFRSVGARGGGRAAHVPEGDYLLECVQAKNVAVKSGKNKGKRQIAWQYRIVGTPDDPEARSGMGDSVYLNTLAEWADPAKQGWFLANMIEDLKGAEVRGRGLGLNLADCIGNRVGATLVDGDPYADPNKPDDEPRVRSEIKYTFPAERFVGVAQGGPSKSAANNGAAVTPAQAKKAVEEADEDEDGDIEELDVQSL